MHAMQWNTQSSGPRGPEIIEDSPRIESDQIKLIIKLSIYYMPVSRQGLGDEINHVSY